MLKFTYNFSIHLYGLFLKIAALFHPKAKKWIAGRKSWKQNLQKGITKDGNWIWFHCASLGEFEQGRNLIEAIKQHMPEQKILLSFFSPSGYEIRKNYKYADHVCYLPLDIPQNAKEFLNIVQPQLVIFIKYELWLNYLAEIREQKIPFLLVSARMQANSPFLKSIFAPLYKKAFQGMAAIFTQDQSTANLLQNFSPNPNIIVTSDTRYDRVAANAEEFRPIEEISQFRGNRLCLVAGSTWPPGENAIFTAWNRLKNEADFCMIIAPHEIHQTNISKWIDQYQDISLRFSNIDQLSEQHRILWIDNIGMLSKLYHYADIAYVGGAWKTGLHNILEATVFGCPVIIGPNYQKFPEASELIQAGGGFRIKSNEEFNLQLKVLLQDPILRKEIKMINQKFIADRVGATDKILTWCTEQSLLNLSRNA